MDEIILDELHQQEAIANYRSQAMKALSRYMEYAVLNGEELGDLEDDVRDMVETIIGDF